jgi:hypothetical protein
MKHVTKYQISAINSYWEKCDEKYLGRTEGQTEVKQYTPPPVKRGYNNKIVDPIRMKQMYRIKLISNTALIIKSLLLNRIIEKLLFESLQTNLIINFCYPFLCWHVTNVFFIDLFLLTHFNEEQPSPTTAAELSVAFQRVWTRIPIAFINRLVNSMYRRCVAVINAGGGHTRY